MMTIQIELESLKNELDVFSQERKQKLEKDLSNKREEAGKLTELWQTGTYYGTFPFPCFLSWIFKADLRG